MKVVGPDPPVVSGPEFFPGVQQESNSVGSMCSCVGSGHGRGEFGQAREAVGT